MHIGMNNLIYKTIARYVVYQIFIDFQMETPITETTKIVPINFNSFLSDINWEDPELWLLSAGCGAGTGKSSGKGRNGTGDGGEAAGEADAT